MVPKLSELAIWTFSTGSADSRTRADLGIQANANDLFPRDLTAFRLIVRVDG